jgi:hypothetical protein
MLTKRDFELPVKGIVNPLITRKAASIQTQVVVNQLSRRPAPRLRVRDTVLDVPVKRIEEIQSLMHRHLSSLDTSLTQLM